MILTDAIERLRARRLTVVAGVLLFAAFTALAARVTIPLPFTPVPITLQVVAVLLTGLVLGSRAGAVSQALYLAAIAGGLPLDAYGRGSAALLGPTGGYLIGFVGAAFVVGWLVERQAAGRGRRFLASMAGVGVIYACGLAWLAPAVGGIWPAVQMGVMPFLPIDLAKALVAATVAESGHRLLSL